MTLPENSIDIWLTRFADVPASALDAYRPLMNAAEHNRNLRLRGASQRSAHTITRALLRTVLSRYHPCPPSRWEFAEGAHGKPYISDPPAPVYFNLSHTTEWVACAIAAFPMIGIDIERTHRNVEVARLSRRFFAPAECEDVLALRGEARRGRFFDYWTLKESYIKARGEGVSLGLDRFSFALRDRAPITIACNEALQDEPAAWQFRLSGTGGDHRLALAARPPHPAAELCVRHFQTIPLRSVAGYNGPLLLEASR